jgi:hypothetical protein
MAGRDPHPKLEAPDATFTRQRWLPVVTVEWATRADAILREHGAVGGVQTYASRSRARWRARKLIRCMVELRLHERWELLERTERRGNEWAWLVELTGSRNGER